MCLVSARKKSCASMKGIGVSEANYVVGKALDADWLECSKHL